MKRQYFSAHCICRDDPDLPGEGWPEAYLQGLAEEFSVCCQIKIARIHSQLGTKRGADLLEMPGEQFDPVIWEQFDPILSRGSFRIRPVPLLAWSSLPGKGHLVGPSEKRVFLAPFGALSPLEASLGPSGKFSSGRGGCAAT